MKHVFQLVLLIYLFTSCKKEPLPEPVYVPETTEEKNGLQWRDLNCYFFVRNSLYDTTTHQFNGFTFRAQFSDPPLDLRQNIDHYFTYFKIDKSDNLPNVALPYVYYSGTKANERQGNNYRLYENGNNQEFTAPETINWKTGKNKTFEEMDITLARGFPRIKNKWSAPTVTINPLKDYVFDPNEHFENYDSIAIVMLVVDQRTPIRFFSNNQKVVISKEQIRKIYYDNRGYVTFVPINYCSRIVNGLKCGYANSISVDQTILLDTLR